jgi:hypothetical protein
MKRISIILIFISSSLFGQDNPMFDSLDYFQRNKIKTVHCQTNSWWYAPPFKNWKISFDKDTKRIKYNSFVFDDTTSSMAKSFSSESSGGWDFRFNDTIIKNEKGLPNDTIRYVFDNNKRLSKKVVISTTPKHSNSIHSKINSAGVRVPHITTTTYFYADASSKRLKKKITESPYYIEEDSYYYDKYLLSIRTSLDSNKLDHKVKLETTVYDYYPDKKLKKETRRVASDHCPGIVGGTTCEGIIEYKYDTEFKNDSTPSGIKPIPYITLITVENKRKSDVYIEVYGYPSDNKGKVSTWLVPHIATDSTYEIIFDPRPEYGIHPRKQDTFWSYKKDKFTSFEILVFPKPEKYVSYTDQPKDILFSEKIKIEPLFKQPRTIQIK